MYLTISITLLVSEFGYILKEACYRKDAKEACSDIKFSPNNSKLAVGSHDNFIYIYSTNLDMNETGGEKVCILKALHRLSGHSSYITHIG